MSKKAHCIIYKQKCLVNCVGGIFLRNDFWQIFFLKMRFLLLIGALLLDPLCIGLQSYFFRKFWFFLNFREFSKIFCAVLCVCTILHNVKWFHIYIFFYTIVHYFVLFYTRLHGVFALFCIFLHYICMILQYFTLCLYYVTLLLQYFTHF